MKLWSKEFYSAVNPQVLNVGIDFAEPGFDMVYKRNSNDFFDIIYVKEGKGKIQIDDHKMQHNPGDIFFIKPGQTLKSESASPNEPYREYFVHCYIFANVAKTAREIFAESCPQQINIKDQKLSGLFEEVFKTFSIQPEHGTLRLKYTMLKILEIIFYNIRYKPNENITLAYTKTLKACKFIEQNFKEKLTVDIIAEHVDMSGSYLMATFKKYLNCSPIAYKINQQLNIAKLLLAQNTSVTETAYKTGFESLHYFSRVFQKQTGMSPTQYAKTCRRKVDSH